MHPIHLGFGFLHPLQTLHRRYTLYESQLGRLRVQQQTLSYKEGLALNMVSSDEKYSHPTKGI